MFTTVAEHSRFKDRAEAGVLLAKQLRERQFENPVVLALPRGGVPVATEIARELQAPIDLLLVRKLGVPGNEELALGAIVDGPAPQIFINNAIRKMVHTDDVTLKQIKSSALQEIERRRNLYLGERECINITGKSVIIVDDGIATGATVNAAIDAVFLQKPARIIIATAVASPEIIAQLFPKVDDIICLLQPDKMHAVGLYYSDFHQLSDTEVMDLLQKYALVSESTRS